MRAMPGHRHHEHRLLLRLRILEDVAAAGGGRGMKYCPLCRVALQPDTNGGNATPRGKIPPKAVLLCTSCWPVYPEQPRPLAPVRSEEHTSELPSLMRISYAIL